MDFFNFNIYYSINQIIKLNQIIKRQTPNKQKPTMGCKNSKVGGESRKKNGAFC